MAGFVSTHIYFTKYDLNVDSMKVGKRLIIRAVKLLLIYLVANIAIACTARGKLRSEHTSPIEYLITWFFTGTYETQSIALLVPIAYTLLGIGALILLSKGRQSVLISTAILLFLSSLSLHNDQTTGYYLRYFSIGFLGAVFGLVSDHQLQNTCGSLSFVSFIYVLLLAAITYTLKTTFLFYSITVVVSVAFFYAMGMKIDEEQYIARKVILIGNYTLIAYLFQIIVFRVLKVVFSRMELLEAGNLARFDMLLASILTTITIWGLVEAVDAFRKASNVLNQIYKSVFA
jgi:hypothetical protein